MASQPMLTVIQGGSDSRVHGSYIRTGVLHSDGTEYIRGGSGDPPGGGENGGEPVTSLLKLDIPRDVQIAKWGLAGLAGVFLAAFWFILSQIDSRFDRADEKVTRVAEQVADVRVEIAGQRGDIKAVLERLNDDQPQGSAGSGQAGSVHQGAPTKP